MGLFDFVKDAGAKISDLFESDEDKAAAKAAEEAASAEEKAAWEEGYSKFLVKYVGDSGLAINELAIGFTGGCATMTGTATSQADREKCVLMVGNVESVAQVDDQLNVTVPADPAVYYTVVKGDTLGAIARTNYGVISLYPTIFEANKPMLKHEDAIFPGQVLRIPKADAPTYTVKKGDTLGGIAKTFYGKAKLYTVIFEGNRDTMSDPNSVKVGQTLIIPLILPASAGGQA